MPIPPEETRPAHGPGGRGGCSSEGLARRERAGFRLSFCLLASLAGVACSLDSRQVGTVGDRGPTPGPNDAGGGETPPGSGADAPPGQEGLPTLEGIPPTGTVSGETNASCDGDGGPCLSVGDGGSACVPTGPRDCSSALDNDCDGRPDDTLDDVCVCAPGSVEPCDDHPGLDGRGQCQPGVRACVLGAGNVSSDWGVCEGSVGPGAQDSCAVEGDDTDCDGTNNGGCPCIEGETRPCGPETDDGICQRGSQSCVNGTFASCVGAVFAAPRDCGSSLDNDCDGRPDDTVDDFCTCVIGSVRACGAHPGRDGNGPCRAGSQTCEGRANDTTSTYGTCTGSVGPALQDTCAVGNDANCNGLPNEGCACVNGQTRACGPDTEVGLCQRGLQTCANGAFGPCQDAVFPAPRDCDSSLDHDCDGRPDDTFDNVCLPPTNPFTCSNVNPPGFVLPFSLMPVDPVTGGAVFPPGPPPAATGGTIQNGRYAPTRVDVYGQAAAPAFAVNELTFEFRDGFAQVGYHAFVGTGAVLGSGELFFVGTATSVGTSLQLDVDACNPTAPCSIFGGVTCAVPASLSYSATANGLVTIQPAQDGSTVVITYSRQ